MTKELSIQAKKLLERVRDPSNFYRSYDERTPKAMQELVDAGLVTKGGRVNVVVSCYVPAGTETFRFEKYPE